MSISQQVRHIRKVLRKIDKPFGLYPNFISPVSGNWMQREYRNAAAPPSAGSWPASPCGPMLGTYQWVTRSLHVPGSPHPAGSLGNSHYGGHCRSDRCDGLVRPGPVHPPRDSCLQPPSGLQLSVSAEPTEASFIIPCPQECPRYNCLLWK